MDIVWHVAAWPGMLHHKAFAGLHGMAHDNCITKNLP